jgi:hypothetical protein
VFASEFYPLLAKKRHGGKLAAYHHTATYWLLVAFLATTAAAVAYASHVPGLTGLAYLWFGVSFQAVIGRVLAGGQPADP